MAATKRPAPKHTLKIEESHDDPEFISRYGGKFVAHCSCGWASDPRSREERARAEHAAHVEQAS